MGENELKNTKLEGRSVGNYRGEIKLLTGNTHPALAKQVAEILGIELVKTEIQQFPNGEIHVQVLENVRGHDVFHLSSLHARTSQAILETQLLIDCIRSSAERIIGIFPWVGYSKQDRRTKPREARSFWVVAKTLSACGLHRVILFDLHNKATADFFDIPTDHVYLMRLLIEEFKSRGLKNVVIASPDIGSGKRADAVARLTGIEDICVVWKVHHPETKELDLSRSRVLGEVKDRDVWFFDDMIQSFGTLETAGRLVKEAGARKIIAAAVHPDFTPRSGDKPSALERIQRSVFDEVIVVETIPRPETEEIPEKITFINPAPFIAHCIELIHRDGPLSPLFLQY